MESIAEILESELKEAVEVRNEKSLHRYVVLLSENIVSQKKHSEEYNSLKSDIKEMLLFMRERFESIDRRFESVDKRFEVMQSNMDKRFESVDKRFEVMQSNMDKRFESVDKRFEEMQSNMDKRFEDVNQRFSMMFRFITVGFVVLATMMSVFQFLG